MPDPATPARTFHVEEVDPDEVPPGPPDGLDVGDDGDDEEGA